METSKTKQTKVNFKMKEERDQFPISMQKNEKNVFYIHTTKYQTF